MRGKPIGAGLAELLSELEVLLDGRTPGEMANFMGKDCERIRVAPWCDSVGFRGQWMRVANEVK